MLIGNADRDEFQLACLPFSTPDVYHLSCVLFQ